MSTMSSASIGSTESRPRSLGTGPGGTDADDFAQRMQRVEELVEKIEQSSDAGARAASREVVRMLLELHGAGLAKVLELLRQADDSGREIVDAFASDELVRSLLLLHDLHPESLEGRVRQALEDVRPYLSSHGGGVTLLEISAGVARLRLEGSCQGCPSSTATLKHTIEQAVYQAAPDISGIEVDGVDSGPDPSQLVQLEAPS